METEGIVGKYQLSTCYDSDTKRVIIHRLNTITGKISVYDRRKQTIKVGKEQRTNSQSSSNAESSLIPIF